MFPKRTISGPTPSRPNLIFITGAPKAADLDWDESTLSNNIGTLPVFSHIPDEYPVPNISTAERLSADTALDASTRYPKWRLLPTHSGTLHIGLSSPLDAFEIDSYPRDYGNPYTGEQPPYIPDQAPSFLPLNLAEDTAFLEHSFSFLSQMEDTVLHNSDTLLHDESTLLDATSFVSTVPDDSLLSTQQTSPTNSQSRMPDVPPNLPLTNIRALPIALHLMRIAPQTVTVNLLCGVISIPPIRSITIRPRHAHQNLREMELLELLVGDETAAGFSITFWLLPVESQGLGGRGGGLKPPDWELRESLLALRPGDTVLITNVALSPFRGKVHGQSLSKRMTRSVETSIFVLDQASRRKRGVGGSDARGSEEGDGSRESGEGRDGRAVDREDRCSLTLFMREKLGKVDEWVSRFVGSKCHKRRVSRGAEDSGGGKRKREWEKEDLPPDTQQII